MKAIQLGFGAAVVAGLAGWAMGQPSVTVDLSGASIPSTGTPSDVVRTSAPNTIDAATGYTYSFNPIVHGSGLLGTILIPTNTPLGDVLNTFYAGSYKTVFGAVRNPGGAVPVTAFNQVVSGTFSGLTINLTLVFDVQADRTARAAIRNIQRPSGAGLNVVSGGATMQVFTPPPPVHSEWHLDGNLQSVKESGLAPSSGPSKIRHLDDHAFGPILGGPGATTTYPNPPTPQDITQAQSAFGTCSSFGIPTIGGVDYTVYKTSPSRNLSDPSNPAKSRGIGLALWPNTHDFWPDSKIGQWTMVWDLYIPAAAWSAEYPVSLVEDNYNNDEMADCLIRQSGGVGSIGYGVPTAQYVTGAGLTHDRWMRLAYVSDGYRTGQGRFFVDGVFIGASTGDWVYNACKPTDPRNGDQSTANPDGTPVAPADWAAWGQFPSPWARSPGSSNVTGTTSTICLFADLMQRGESVYVANMFFADEAMTDSQIGAFGGANARGIEYLTPATGGCGSADFNCDGDVGTDADISAFFSCLAGNCPAAPCTSSADFNGDGNVGTDSDVEAFFGVLAGGAC
jgi:hypothetical protein